MNYLTMLMYQNQYRTIRTPLYEDEYEQDYDDYEEYNDEMEKDDDMGMSL